MMNTAKTPGTYFFYGQNRLTGTDVADFLFVTMGDSGGLMYNNRDGYVADLDGVWIELGNGIHFPKDILNIYVALQDSVRDRAEHILSLYRIEYSNMIRKWSVGKYYINFSKLTHESIHYEDYDPDEYSNKLEEFDLPIEYMFMPDDILIGHIRQEFQKQIDEKEARERDKELAQTQKEIEALKVLRKKYPNV